LIHKHDGIAEFHREANVKDNDLLVKVIRSNPDLSYREAVDGMEAVFNAITNALAAGQRVELRGFGSFAPKTRNSYIGRNPRTGEPVAVPEKVWPTFRAGKPLWERLNSKSKP
jgi:integration host factor subunit beta